jgi:hypothetical protein
MMQKSTTFVTIFRLKNCYFHYDMQKKLLEVVFLTTNRNEFAIGNFYKSQIHNWIINDKF